MTMASHYREMTSSLDRERWLAVQSRDSSRDGEFVFAVRTTGIYCRPSCPARRARVEHVRFFDDAAAAERAGFRACRRCRPQAAMSAHDELVARASAWIDEHMDERVTLARLAEVLEVSPGHVQRTFTRVAGVSPRAYAASRRLEAAKAAMRAGADVTRAIHVAGYGSSSRFYEQAKTELAMTPSSYRRGGAGMTIRYATAACSLGRVLVAATERGICAVSFGDDDAALVAALEDEYPRADISRDDDALRLSLTTILASSRDRAPLATLPLDVAGSLFQREVWQALRKIPEGERRTYGELGASIGRPNAARAVAGACAANPAAVLIPCHRVVRGDGEPGGYRWGLDRKRALLAAENPSS